ncbi:MAG: hypothetical protein HOI95_01285 [Chromatiales bacterium]|nr:hypothetical protein [Chromatiales bacterium]
MLDISGSQTQAYKSGWRFFCKLLKGQGQVPLNITTDKLASDGAAKREVMRSCLIVEIATSTIGPGYPTSTLTSVSRKFEGSDVMIIRRAFLSEHDQCHNLFWGGRHVLRAGSYRVLWSWS